MSSLKIFWLFIYLAGWEGRRITRDENADAYNKSNLWPGNNFSNKNKWKYPRTTDKAKVGEIWEFLTLTKLIGCNRIESQIRSFIFPKWVPERGCFLTLTHNYVYTSYSYLVELLNFHPRINLVSRDVEWFPFLEQPKKFLHEP